MKSSEHCSSTLTLKRALLRTLYEVYDHLSQGFSAACHRECTICCTHNVLATSLEVDLVFEVLTKTGRGDLLERLISGAPGRRMRPTLSINGFAECCLKRQEPPFHHQEYDLLPCPIRESYGCPVYAARPFSCRALWSMRRCKPDEAAVIPPRLLTINGMFEQIIEHVDSSGLCGNMLDLAELFSGAGVRSGYHQGIPSVGSGFLVQTRRNPGFLIPDEHKPDAGRVLDLLRDRIVEGEPFFKALHMLRDHHSKTEFTADHADTAEAVGSKP